ncbi:MAG TPA: hypothetical protein VGF36_05325, partial [Rhodopila sp.]
GRFNSGQFVFNHGAQGWRAMRDGSPNRARFDNFICVAMTQAVAGTNVQSAGSGQPGAAYRAS